ncbi:hypothetical protein Tco_0696854 [Tanacetum coccineum]
MRWVDRRFKDSFPVVVVENLCRIVLDCVKEDPSKRPKISCVTGKVSRLYLDSGELADIIHVPNDFTAYFVTRGRRRAADKYKFSSREVRTEVDEEQIRQTAAGRFRQQTVDSDSRQQIETTDSIRQQIQTDAGRISRASSIDSPSYADWERDDITLSNIR